MSLKGLLCKAISSSRDSVYIFLHATLFVLFPLDGFLELFLTLAKQNSFIDLSVPLVPMPSRHTILVLIYLQFFSKHL